MPKIFNTRERRELSWSEAMERVRLYRLYLWNRGGRRPVMMIT
jgi:hypothetical protein